MYPIGFHFYEKPGFVVLGFISGFSSFRDSPQDVYKRQAQHYVQLLGGELKLESTPDVGTTFIFDLPFMEGKGYLRIVS